MGRFVAVVLLAVAAFGQNGKIQQPGEIQQPKGPWQVPGEIQKPGDIRRVKEQCTTRLSVGSDALFEFNKSELTPQAQKTLALLGPQIQKEGKHPVVIEGYTDSVGTTEYNQQLSEKRARAVADWFQGHGFLSASRTVGYGKNKPVAPNAKPDGSDNPEGREKNRRVEVVIDTCK